ncbi:putative lipoxygenase 6, chloroplastic-like [Capsicum annuum]|uniref:F-box domain-containing protein n=1 Tax=Capsicum annuum TaxID=4072 RepID=A0A2G2YCG6_CAPAN|nr:putative lipoxygenase 6, chloroplastic-like [Capsicum annuum]KAF3678483.1 putative lipoxygenase 6, chloroplastic-like [Capsicum annuum]PHT67442.1 hypothetical protein T459_26929 [Capsicum annuum]
MMPPNGRKQRLSPSDVLSNLPDSLINDILTRLPLRDAVRTSILSKKWRYKWNGIQHLVLKLPMDNQHKLLPNQYKLPSSLFTCSQLKHLFLQQCLIHPPPLFKGFDKLISLELIEVTISSELLVSLISHSPLLDHLVLDCNEVSHHIEISAPKLRSFFFAGNIDFLHLKNVPLLSKVSYEPVEFSIDAEHDLAKIFESIPALENLCWNHGCLQMYFISDEEYNEPVPRDAIDEIPASFSDMTFNHLKTVKIKYVSGAKAELQLIKILIGYSCFTMLPNGKKHACDQSVSLDLLTSSLPENVIDDILICLPLRDAVRTSILSTKWRYKWCRIPQLNLDPTLWGTAKDVTLITKFTNIMCHLFASHVGSITKVILENYYLGDCPVIDKLIYFLSRNSVQHLDFSFDLCNPPKLPSSIFNCSQLMHLSLRDCSIQFAPPAFKGFDRLITLELCRITISSKLLESFISSCPLLDKLGLHETIHSGVIEINAPMLRAFDFTEGEGSIILKSVPRLVKLSLCYLFYYADTRNCFDSFYYLEHLDLKCESLKLLSAAASEVPIRLPFDLNCLKHLRLDEICFAKLEVLSFVLFLIRSSQHLQYLEIEIGHPVHDDSPEQQCLKLEAFSDVTFNHLKKVKLRGIIGSNREMQLIKLLLAKFSVCNYCFIMSSNREKHACQSVPLDALSSFPENIVDDILICLPLQDALGLYHNCYSDAIEISAPMLQTFDFIERIGFICIKTVPNFAKPSLWHVESHLGTGNCFEIISALEHLE